MGPKKRPEAMDIPAQIANLKANNLIIEDGKIPLYAAIELFTFGTLALFYKSMKVEDRKASAKMYKNVNEHYLSSWRLTHLQFHIRFSLQKLP